MRLSARGYHRVLHVARSLADLDASDTIRRLDIAETVSYRRVVLAAGWTKRPPYSVGPTYNSELPQIP